MTFTELVGTIALTSPTTYGKAFTTLANNNSANAVAVGKGLVNEQHRLLIQGYFDNERTFGIGIVGKSNITFSGSLSVGAVSATLSTPWPNITCQQLVGFSSGDQRSVLFTNNSTAVTWNVGLAHTATTSASTVGLRDYPIPANVSKIKDVTVTIGQLVYTPTPIQTRTEWDYVNTLPYTADIPQWYFVYNNTVGIWPIPSTQGNVLSFNYKTRVPDLSFDDYSTGNITTAAVGTYAITGTGTSWGATGKYPLNTNISFLNLNLRIDPPYGDGLWYPIQSFTDDTHLTLALPIINAPNITAGTTYTIGQLPLLEEDFHPTIVYGALAIYYSSIVDNPERFKMYSALYEERKDLMKDYLGTKQVSVDLEEEIYLQNPNLFPYQSS